MTVTLPPDTPPSDPPTAARLAYPCDRCSTVAPLYPARPGELLCTACLAAARHHDRSIP